MQTVIEIRQGQGGDDAKALVRLQFDIYEKLSSRIGL